jgi:cation diffusion facilitator CzcD-associated flavoprotein CzcO
VDRAQTSSPKIVIVGAGMSGLCLAIRLKQAGFRNVVILEKSNEVGGTWNENTYPNAGCDVPSYLYSYSFAPNYKWTMKYARQPEILAYLRDCADRFQIRPWIRFETAVVSAVFDEVDGRWVIETDSGDRLAADVFVSAVGQLNRPNVPCLEGLENFQGETWHTARWNHDYELFGKTVAVIGNGASAIQLVPEIARQAKQTYVFQRSACWIHPLRNYPYSTSAKLALRYLPLCASLHRLYLFLMCEWRILALREGSKLNKEYARWLRRKMRRLIPVDQWPLLIPNYAPGCKRILLSSDYLPTLQRDDVEVVTEEVKRFNGRAVVTESTSRQVDAVIFATGFQATRFLQPMEIRGRDGRSIEDVWDGRPKAFYGMATPGFPNLFMLYGPNTNLGHNSIVFMVERQVNYLIRCLTRMQETGAKLIEVRRGSMEQFDTDVQTRLASSVWAGDCSSWYKSADGRIPNNWWGSAFSFWMRTRRPNYADFHFSRE